MGKLEEEYYKRKEQIKKSTQSKDKPQIPVTIKAKWEHKSEKCISRDSNMGRGGKSETES